MIQSDSLARVQVTVVATRGEEIHIYVGQLPRAEAISKANADSHYPDGTTFLVLWRDADFTKTLQTAQEIHEAVKQMKGLIFK